MSIPNHFVNNFDSRSGAIFEDETSIPIPQEFMHCFNVNEEISVAQDELIDPEEEGEPHDLFEVANMEWEQYVPGVSDASKEKAPLEPAVRNIITLESWKQSRQEIESMEVDTVAIRKAETQKWDEEMKEKKKKGKKNSCGS